MRATLLGLATLALPAQEFSFSAGRLHGIGTRDATYSWQLGYAQALGPRYAWSVGWLNEGHLPGHHRDGATLMGWRVLPMEGRPRLRLAFGAGLYRTFDTEDQGTTYANRHALKGILGASIQMPFGDTPWGGQLHLARSVLSSNQDTRTLQLGLTYSFRKADAVRPRILPDRASDCQSLTLYYGTAILNSQTSQNGEAFALEYRRRWSDRFDWTVAYSDEGDLELVRRDTLAFQAWATSTHLGGRLLLGIGAGPTLCHALTPEGQPPPERSWGTGARITMAATWRFEASPWQVKAAWNRTRTPNDRDTDLIATGIGLAF